jgi:hypothetical protein
MSSLSSLKSDIASFTDDLVRETGKLVDLEVDLLNQQKVVDILKDQVTKLKRALAIIEGDDSILEVGDKPRAPPSPEPRRPEPIPKRVLPQGPPCSACGTGVMLPATKRTPSGAYINILLCSDPSCNNEAM